MSAGIGLRLVILVAAVFVIVVLSMVPSTGGTAQDARMGHETQRWSQRSPEKGGSSGKISKAVVRPQSNASGLQKRLLSIILPVIDFEGTTLEEAVDFIPQRAIELNLVIAQKGPVHHGEVRAESLSQDHSGAEQGDSVAQRIHRQTDYPE